MARILLHTLVFAPDGVSTSILLSELMQDLRGNGHQITVLTTYPHYNRDMDAEAKQPLQKHLGGLFYTSSHCGIPVIHTYMPRKGQGLSGRLRDYLTFHFLSLILGIFMIGRQDVVITPSPPLSIGVIGWILAVMKGGILIYNVQELYPSLAVQMGLTRSGSLMYRLMAWMEKFVYNRATVVVVICEQFRRHVAKLGLPVQKILKIPNFVDIDFVRPLPKDNPLARRHGLVDKFVVLYAGNIGMTQSFDTIMEVASRLANKPAIQFLIVGDGAKREYVVKQIEQRRLFNITLLTYQPHSEIPYIYASGDLGLVPLMAGTAHTTVPSKIYTIMASGRPAIVSVDPDSELAWLVEQAKCGLAIPPDNANALEAGIQRIFNEQELFRAYGINGRSYVEQHFSRRVINEQFHHLMEQFSRNRQ